ncbi:phosphopentomutase [Candidatus Uabimicrobium sp. HlEnr_7]|uniref:phosphopentomutase n=1 Tax=Candidatus Uabimicrobium helgolandensis TaxID=3095367 RepID=UPI003556D404
MTFDRIFLIILDGVGAGASPDADQYGDENSNTLLHVHQHVGLKVPNMSRLGMSNIIPTENKAEIGAWGTMQERSQGKDTTTGHWEISGVVLDQAFPTYPQGFPQSIVELFCKKIARGVLGNYPASGTAIIEELGDEHVHTGKPIIYTSADSVFQIAAHEDVIPPTELYEMCKIAREILVDEHCVGRVIARPFTGKSGNYTRTSRRKDFSVEPLGITILDALKDNNLSAIGIGKISDIFAARGVTNSFPEKGNAACMESLFKCMQDKFRGLVFVNLIDFDMLYGHRNNPQGFAEALETFDNQVPELISAMTDKDLLIITADHGNDPTTATTDHSREYVPLLVFQKQMSQSISLGVRSTFADIAKTIDENFSLNKIKHGTSFLSSIQ